MKIGGKKISVLVVDDSAFMRKALKRMLSSDPMIRVAGEAQDGPEALEALKRLKPDVITLDVKMPGMDGLQVLEKIMAERPTPVLMVSSLTSEGGGITLQALEKGAVDFIDKSSCHTNMDILEIADSLVNKVKILSGVDLQKVVVAKAEQIPKPLIQPRPMPEIEGNPTNLVAIGASTGGPMSLEKVITAIPANYPGAILIVQHMPPGFTRSLADRLNHHSALEVKEAEEEDLILPGRAYIAPGGYHLKVRPSNGRYYCTLSNTPRDTLHVPSVDVLMLAVANAWPGKILAIIMTGMGADGAEGIKAIKAKGGRVIAQNEETCVVYGMPRAAYLSGAVDYLVPLSRISEEIGNFR